jgi:hypothetical protein
MQVSFDTQSDDRGFTTCAAHGTRSVSCPITALVASGVELLGVRELKTSSRVLA